MAKDSDWTARLAQVKAEIRASRAFFDQFDADGKPVSYTRAARELRAMGLKVTRSEDSEIRVAFPGNESAAYYTDSVEDAAFTGLDMVARAMPRALWSFPASRVADAIDGAEWLCSAESFGFDGSEALAFN